MSAKKQEYKYVHHLCPKHCLENRNYEECKKTSEHAKFDSKGCNICSDITKARNKARNKLIENFLTGKTYGS